jgi:hypothetical protein
VQSRDEERVDAELLERWDRGFLVVVVVVG